MERGGASDYCHDGSDDDAGIVWGDAAVSLIYVEVRPCCPCSWRGVAARKNDNARHRHPHAAAPVAGLTAACVKAQLMRSTLRSLLFWRGGEKNRNTTADARIAIQEWSSSITGDQESTGSERRQPRPSLLAGGDLGMPTLDEGQENLLYFRSNDPTCTELWPCRCRGYARAVDLVDCGSPTRTAAAAAMQPPILVSESTFVRVHPIQCGASSSQRCCSFSSANNWKYELTGEMPKMFVSEMEEAFLATQNASTIKEFSLRMKLNLSDPTRIGTTADALEKSRRQKFEQRRRVYSLNASLDCCIGKKPSAMQTMADQDTQGGGDAAACHVVVPSIFRDGGLLIHSPDHGSGKTCLVELVAHRLGASTYVIRAGPLLAEYGVHADTALQCSIHAAALDGAIRGKSVCIILDDLDAFLSTNNALASAGDAANPVEHGIASYLHTLTSSIRNQHELPFPSNNPLYNLAGKRGVVLTVHLCIVAVLTCADDDKRLAMPTLTSMGMYRLPSLTSTTRLTAFRWALAKEWVQLSPKLELQFPFLAASAVWARGELFRRIARSIRARSGLEKSGAVEAETVIATARNVEEAFAEVSSALSKACNVQFLATENAVENENDHFGTIGGCQEAKLVLEDALSLDPRRRKLLLSFGLSPPTGVLLYGPPGTGKTLLAKAVARLLPVKGGGGGAKSSFVGGAFVSISSTDIVRATVGSGERIVVSAFQTARLNSPAVVFIDEFQALFTERGGGGSSRLSTTLLQCMDDVKQWGDVERSVEANAKNIQESNRTGQVLVLAATNTPWMIDSAFLRPGRFDRAVHVDLPTLEERAAILHIHVGCMNTAFTGDASTLSEVCNRIANATYGYSGAGLAALCRSAAVQCLVDQSDRLEETHFMQVLDEGIVSQTSSSLVLRNRQWRP